MPTDFSNDLLSPISMTHSLSILCFASPFVALHRFRCSCYSELFMKGVPALDYLKRHVESCSSPVIRAKAASLLTALAAQHTHMLQFMVCDRWSVVREAACATLCTITVLARLALKSGCFNYPFLFLCFEGRLCLRVLLRLSCFSGFL